MTVRMGQGEYQYELVEGWGKLPDGWAFGEVGAVAVDKKDQVYVFNRGKHPMIVFDRDGNFLRSWGEGLFSRAHGIDIDERTGVIWVGLNSGHYAEFDRRKCTGPLNGPTATGQHCPEGWSLYRLPGPQFPDVDESGSAEASYYTWVDQHNTSGLGENIPISTGNLNDGFLALKDGKGVMVDWRFIDGKDALPSDDEVKKLRPAN